MTPRSILRWGRLGPVVALIGTMTLAACNTTEATRSATVAPEPAWRIVERVGEVHYRPPDRSSWVLATPGQVLAGGSEVTTGGGGRVIVAHGGDHVSAGPASRLRLPAPNEPLRQETGWLRYRVAERAEPGAAMELPFRVATPFLNLEVLGTVFDVTVNGAATEVAVDRGIVRVTTPDLLRSIDLVAGQTAYAGAAEEERLAVRRAPDGQLEAIAPVVLHAAAPTIAVPAPPAEPPSEPVAIPAPVVTATAVAPAPTLPAVPTVEANTQHAPEQAAVEPGPPPAHRADLAAAIAALALEQEGPLAAATSSVEPAVPPTRSSDAPGDAPGDIAMALTGPTFALGDGEPAIMERYGPPEVFGPPAPPETMLTKFERLTTGMVEDLPAVGGMVP